MAGGAFGSRAVTQGDQVRYLAERAAKQRFSRFLAVPALVFLAADMTGTTVATFRPRVGCTWIARKYR